MTRIYVTFTRLILAIITITSCCMCDNHNVNKLITSTPCDTLRGILLESAIDSRMACLTYYSDYGLVTIAINYENVIQIRDTIDGAVLHKDINIGKGSAELMNYLVAGFDSEMNELHFISSVDYRKYHITSNNINLIEEIPFNKGFPRFNSGTMFGSNSLIINTIFNGNNIGLCNKNGANIAHIEYQLFGDEVNYDLQYHNLRIATNEKDGLFVTGDIDFSYLAMFYVNDDKIEKKWGKYLVEPDYQIINNSYYLGKNHIDGVEWVELTCENIFVLHDLRPYNTTQKQKHTFLLVFDYNGKMVNKYFLDYKIHSVSFAPDNITFYGVTEHPDVHIVKYQLP